MPAPFFTANADYTVIDRSPMVLEPAEQVRVGHGDRAWPGWILVVKDDGRSSYVPERAIRVDGGGTGTVLEKFDATDLSVRKGERIVSLREVDGWHWARGTGGQEGWLPGYVLDPAG